MYIDFHKSYAEHCNLQFIEIIRHSIIALLTIHLLGIEQVVYVREFDSSLIIKTLSSLRT